MLAHPQILVIDDDQETVDGAVLRLKSAGFETIVAKEGVEGVMCAHEYRPDAIILDMRMPTWDGLRVLSELRASSDTFQIPVVMLSGSLGDRQEALRAGARLFLSKPCSGGMLIEAVKHVIHEAHTVGNSC